MGCSQSSSKNFIVIQAFLKKQKNSQMNYLTYHIKELEKEEQTKPTVSRRKEIIKIREEINKIEIKTIEKINEIKSFFFFFFKDKQN